jgi:hypothetical protein
LKRGPLLNYQKVMRSENQIPRALIRKGDTDLEALWKPESMQPLSAAVPNSSTEITLFSRPRLFCSCAHQDRPADQADSLRSTRPKKRYSSSSGPVSMITALSPKIYPAKLNSDISHRSLGSKCAVGKARRRRRREILTRQGNFFQRGSL